MKANIHPDCKKVIYSDISSDFKFLAETTTVNSKETIKWEDGNTYPLIKVEISSASHPFYTGGDHIVDTEGRVEKFKKRFNLK